MHDADPLCLGAVLLCWGCLCFSARQSSHHCVPALFTRAFLIRCVFVPAVLACAAGWAVSNLKQLSARMLKHLFFTSAVLLWPLHQTRLRWELKSKHAQAWQTSDSAHQKYSPCCHYKFSWWFQGQEVKWPSAVFDHYLYFRYPTF